MSAVPDYAEALTAAMQAVHGRITAEDTIELAQGAGRVLARDVSADRDLPPFDRAQMDGYALRAAEYAPGKAFAVAGVIHAGQSPVVNVPPGSCVAIATGAALPEGTDAVIPHEQCAQGRNAAGPVTFTLPGLAAGHAVHARGCDARAGSAVLRAGTMLEAQHLGILAAVGGDRIHVRRRPVVTIITSGDEVVNVSDEPKPWQIRNSNSVMLCALVARFGGEVRHSVHVPDDAAATHKAVSEAAASSDMVITVGGVSAGERDHFHEAYRGVGAELVLQGAAIQPGRPVVVGRCAGGAVIVGLPGNPVSALACAHLFVWPLVRATLGMSEPLPWTTVTLAGDVKPNAHRRAFRPAIPRADGTVTVPAWGGSGDLVHTAPTHGLLELPVQSQAVAAGERLRFLPWA